MLTSFQENDLYIKNAVDRSTDFKLGKAGRRVGPVKLAGVEISWWTESLIKEYLSLLTFQQQKQSKKSSLSL